MLPSFALYNLDILLIGTTVATIAVLGFIVFFDNPKSATSKAFLFLAIITCIWSALNYFTYQTLPRNLFLVILRLAIFFAVWNSFAVFQLFYTFPREKITFPKWYFTTLIPSVAIVSLLTLTSLVFSDISEISAEGRVLKVINGPAIPLFGLAVIGLVFGGFFLAFKKMKQATGLEKTQFKYITTGAVISFSLIIIFNLIFPAFLNNPRFVIFGAVFLVPFILFTFYAVIRHHLLNVKIVSSELLTLILAIITLIEVLLSTGIAQVILRLSIFLFILAFGILLIRSVRKEVKQKEELEQITKDLQLANDKLKELDDLKTDFISIASHQLRTPLTAIKGYSSMIMEGTYGDSSLQIKGVVDKIFQSSQRLIFIVNDLLDISRIEQGRFTISPEETKLANVIRDVTEELKANAEKKNIALSFEVGVEDAEIKVNADFNKIRQVFTNLIDNALKYTNEGYVKVMLESQGDKALVSIKDSGIGIATETIPNLFQKFTRAKGVSKLHTDGSGLGLYVAREIVKAHHGEAWVESEGEGKGSQFYVLLPLKKPNTEEIEQFMGGV